MKARTLQVEGEEARSTAHSIAGLEEGECEGEQCYVGLERSTQAMPCRRSSDLLRI